MQVPRGFESENGSVCLSGQRGSFAFRQKVGRADRSAILINEYDLPTLLLNWRRLDRITNAIAQRKRRRHAPGIVDICVVSLNGAPHLGLFTESLDRQVGAFTRVKHLSKANQT